MKKAFFVGLGFVGAISLGSLIMQDLNIILVFSGLVAVVSLLLAGVFSGAMVSGDRNRGNFQTETKKQRHERTGTAVIFTMIGLPNLLAAIIAYIFIT